MKRHLGHDIYTVGDLITALKMFDDAYTVGVNSRGLIGYSIKEFKTEDDHGVLDIGLQMSYDPLRGFLAYNDEGELIDEEGKPYQRPAE